MNLCKLESVYNVLNNPNESRFMESLFNIFKTTEIGIVKIGNKDYVMKKEFFVKNFPLLNKIYKFLNLDVNENKFYKKYKKQIYKYKFQNNIQLPYEYKLCKNFNLYLFKKIKYNLNSQFLKKLNRIDFYNILEQATFITYFLNHYLKVFHNDLHQSNKIRNFMVNPIKKTEKKILKIGDNKITIKNYNVIMIDLGLFSKKLSIKNILFYQSKQLKYFYSFEIKSELLIVVYIFLINFFRKKDINFKKLYLYFYNMITKKDLEKSNNIKLKLFDNNILKNIKKIKNIIKML